MPCDPNHLRRIPPKGQTYCEHCGKPVLSWTITTTLIDGHFYDLCRTCLGVAKQPLSTPNTGNSSTDPNS